MLRLPAHVRRVYAHFGFPVGEWLERYRLGFHCGNKNKRVHGNYRAVAASLDKPDSNGERARIRYYERKRDRLMVGHE